MSIDKVNPLALSDPKVFSLPWFCGKLRESFRYLNSIWAPLNIFTLKKVAAIIYEEFYEQFMEDDCYILWNAFLDFAILGILRFQLKSEAHFTEVSPYRE